MAMRAHELADLRIDLPLQAHPQVLDPCTDIPILVAPHKLHHLPILAPTHTTTTTTTAMLAGMGVVDDGVDAAGDCLMHHCVHVVFGSVL